jgi:hypothetical protein
MLTAGLTKIVIAILEVADIESVTVIVSLYALFALAATELETVTTPVVESIVIPPVAVSLPEANE